MLLPDSYGFDRLRFNIRPLGKAVFKHTCRFGLFLTPP